MNELLILKGWISELPEDDKGKVEAAAVELRALLEKYGELGTMSLALVALEVGEKE